MSLSREEVYVERRTVNEDDTGTGAILDGDETIWVPIMEEKVEVTKRPVVKEEHVIGKREVQETEQVKKNMKREEADIETDGSGIVKETDRNK
ncbi:YsnF/AvaK domain-containing protein [Mesobacillus zeae]|uniref:YsnF/AvaK domain-containing protein n=1 Tax=Mesobacillus zeae TaxID=1917180 RepID=A0A398BGF1_9BACI|nr:YsnF/AvaK domain-containing protein [Mesobacillus zeae]RID87758.1 YsnF/AvaK domain-containing protein [Mesobacillus zeae]